MIFLLFWSEVKYWLSLVFQQWNMVKYEIDNYMNFHVLINNIANTTRILSLFFYVTK